MPNLVFYLDDGSTLSYALELGSTSVGRHPDCQIVLNDPTLAEYHASFDYLEQGCYVTDQSTETGTTVQGAPISQTLLQDGDQIALGNVQAIFYQEFAEELPTQVYAPAPVPTPELSRTEIPPVPVMTAAVGMPKPRIRHHKQYGAKTIDSGGGWGTFLISLCLFFMAVAAGLYLRHDVETGGRNLLTDLQASWAKK
jgi:pSer/pThr/pTyr-binding forkhead associated (FHA) protein